MSPYSDVSSVSQKSVLYFKLTLNLTLKSQIQRKSHQQVEEITAMREEMTGMMADLRAKEIQSEALAQEVESLPHDLTR